MLQYHITVNSALKTVARLARLSPLVAVIEVPVSQAEQVAQRQLKRFPSITATHVTRTALRKVGVAAVQLVIMPPKGGLVTLLLMSNIRPSDSREVWFNGLDATSPLTWRNYELSRGKNGAVTWRLSAAARDHYRKRLARLIAGRGGLPAPGQQPYQLPEATSRDQVLKLAAHMQHYPGFSGVRADVFDLAQYSTRVWRKTQKGVTIPMWPTMPYTRFSAPQTAPLSALSHHQEEPDDQDQDEAQDINQ